MLSWVTSCLLFTYITCPPSIYVHRVVSQSVLLIIRPTTHSLLDADLLHFLLHKYIIILLFLPNQLLTLIINNKHINYYNIHEQRQLNKQHVLKQEKLVILIVIVSIAYIFYMVMETMVVKVLTNTMVD